MPFSSLTAFSAAPLVCGSQGTDPSLNGVDPGSSQCRQGPFEYLEHGGLIVAANPHFCMPKPECILLELLHGVPVLVVSLARHGVREKALGRAALSHKHPERASAVVFSELVSGEDARG